MPPAEDKTKYKAPAPAPAGPTSLKPEDTRPSTYTGIPSYPSGVLNPDYQPASKDEAKIASRLADDRWNEYRRSLAAQGIQVDFDKATGQVFRVVKVEQPTLPKPPDKTQEEWDFFLASTGQAGGGKPIYESVFDPEGTQFYMDSQRSFEVAKGLSASGGSGGAAAAYMDFIDLETPKAKEIQRQWKDFEDRATSFYDLMADEQSYGMRANNQNIQNMKAQQDLGLAGLPGGYYTKPPMSSAFSNIVGQSVPSYVRPDYRLNQTVGLPGPQGFDNENYDQFGFPAYAFGTEAQARLPEDRIMVPDLKVPWPWGGR